ncbi:MAG: hypothetical protein K2Q45_00370 [Nitrosomonas sp.]|nr:hypothetical protein [Nitrosomonas sp.]
MSDSREEHTCSHAYCNPQSEEHVYRGDILSSNVFLCKYGKVHVCTETACTLYLHTANQTCPISGFQHATMVSNYNKNNSRTWNLKLEHVYLGVGKRETEPAVVAPDQRPQKKRRGTIPHQEQLSNHASNIVNLLLFSNARIERNNEAVRIAQLEAEEARQTHLKTRALQKQQPFWTDVYRLTGHHLCKPLPLTIFERNNNLHDYYVNIILQVWERVQKFYVLPKDKVYDLNGIEIVPRLDFTCICLGTMYIMRQGLRLNQHMLLPKDDFLLLNLPVGNELVFFKIEKSDINKGDKIITDAYLNAFAIKAPISEIVTDINSLPEHREDENEIVHVHGATVPAKINGSGQFLFMPQSRKGAK